MRNNTLLLIIGWIFLAIEFLFLFKGYDSGVPVGLALGFLISSLILQCREDRL